jgi:hypothetical protein
VWQHKRAGVLVDVSVEQIEQVLWDAGEELVSLGVVPEP